MRKFVITAILLVAACNTQPPNQNPVIASFDRNPNSGAAPLSVTFSWSISDPNSDALTCKVDVNNDGTFEYTLSACTSSSTQSHTYSSAGTFTAKLRIEDGKGGSAEQTVSVTVNANNPPVISSFTPTPSSGNVPLAVNFSWSISDPDGDALVCKLDVDNNGTFEFTLTGCTSSTTQSRTYSSAGTFTAKLRVEDGKGGSAEQTKSITVINPPADAYDITLRFSGSPTAGQQAAFTSAAAKWSQVITTGFASFNLNIAADACRPGFAAFNGSVDDILIDAQVVAIDGPGGILGQAGPCLVRTSNNLSVYGVMKFDSADVANLEASGQLVATIFHEMGHVLGVGTLWNFPSSGTGARNLLQGAGTTNPRFVGAKAVTEWQTLGGTGNVPVENCLDGSNNPIPGCGAGTKDSHWREAIFNTEIMTGYLDSGSNPLSRMTIGSMEDLGYTVNYGAADPFTLLKAQSAQNFATKQQLKVELITPMGSVGP